MKRILALLLCFCLSLGLLTGCGSDSDEPYVPTGDALVMEGQDPDSVGPQKEEAPQEFSLAYYPERGMNPLSCNDFTNRVLFSLMYQPLFTVNSKHEAEPILCSAFQVAPSNMIYTCYIEPDARFSDGSPVTAEDVVSLYRQNKEARS